MNSDETEIGRGGREREREKRIRCLWELNRVRRSDEADLNKGNRLADAN